MDPRLKTALAVVVGVVIGMTLLGGAMALPLAFHAVGRSVAAGDEAGFRMMDQRQGMMTERQGMMDQRQGMMGQAPQWNADGTNACPSGGQGGGMRGPGQRAPRTGDQTCPNGANPSTCPNYTAPEGS